MKTMPAGEFKARCLAVMESVRVTREPVLITKRGSPLAKLVPPEEAPEEFVGRLQGIVKVTGDIESEIQPAESWEVLR